MRTLVLLTLLAGCGGDDKTADPGPTNPLVMARPYDLNVPVSYHGQPTPVVIMLHGYSATPFVEEGIYGLMPLSEERGFLYATPSGNSDADHHPFWNATDRCCDFGQTGVDDVAYLNAVIDDLEARFNVDRKRVFVTGHSNGGFMSNRLACDSASRLAAIVSLAGATWADQTRCNPSEPVSMLEVHGDADEDVPYDGEPGEPGAQETVADWATKNGCDPTLKDTGMTMDLVRTVVGDETSVARHDCTHGAAELWTMHGVGHVPDFAHPLWGNVILDWMFAHAKP